MGFCTACGREVPAYEDLQDGFVLQGVTFINRLTEKRSCQSGRLILRPMRASSIILARRSGVLVGRRHGNDAFYPTVCGDPRVQEQKESGRLGAKDLLHIG